MNVLEFSNYLGILDFLQEFISLRVAGLIFEQAVYSENLRAWSSGYTGRMRVRSCPRRGITEHEKEEQIDSQPSLVLDWKLSRSQNIDQPTELKGVLLYMRRWKPLPFRITRILGMMRLFFLQHRYLYISSFYPLTNGVPVYLMRSVFLVKVRRRHLYTISQGSVLANSPTPYLWAP